MAAVTGLKGKTCWGG